MEVEIPLSKKLIPYTTFCYNSIKSSLQRFVKRPDFEELCENWRSREIKSNILQDIYDGRIWKEFNGGQFCFFNESGNYGLILNIDWFQPYKNIRYSIGAIYMAFLNLPR